MSIVLLSEAILYVLNQIGLCYGHNSRLLSANMDGIFIVNPKRR